MATYEWYARQRDYAAEKAKKLLVGELTNNHPLKAIIVTEVKAVEKRGTPVRSAVINKSKTVSSRDPLTISFEGTDPLSQLAAEADNFQNKQMHSFMGEIDKDSATDDFDDTFEPFSAKKALILAKYTTSEKLSITTSFLSASDKEKVVIKSQTTMTDKVKNRLEQLDDFEEGSVQEMLNLSQQEYVKRIDELNQALITAWNMDQRVKSLKIVIQCSKLLADISVIQFYPSKFVLITDILDTFGMLVFERLRDKAKSTSPGSASAQLPDKFTPDQVPESAKETCRNWFFKIASIRELVPRFYVETAILKCYNFLDEQEHLESLKRLCLSTRGIGNPLVSAYARCYLCRVGVLVAPDFKDYLIPCFDDFLFCYHQVQGDSVQNALAKQKIEMPKYLTLYSPALDWLLQCIAHKATESTLKGILQKTQEQCNSALLLNSIMSAFHPEYVAARAFQFVEMIKNCEEMGFPKHMLYRTLGSCLAMSEILEDRRLPVLNEVWKIVMKLKIPSDYIGCAEVWIEYVAKHFGKREINTILSDIIKHMSPDRAFEDFYPQLQSIISKILGHMHNFSELFALEKFLPFLDMFQKESVKVEVCKLIMEAFNKYQTEATTDPVIINAMMSVCKTVHDSVNALSLEDEKRSISHLITGFIKKIIFGRDFEQQLSFYVEARASYSNLDAVLVTLIQCVNNLAMETHQVVKGNHSRKTAAFVRACVAYSYITIPSLQSVLMQLSLNLLSGRVALLNQCLSQADAFFKASISLIPDVPKTFELDGKVRLSEPYILDFLHNFISTLLIVPDNPDAGVMYLVRGLLNILQNYTWESSSDSKVIVYTRVLAMLSASCQEQYPYHISKIDSNDALYSSDPRFVKEVEELCSTLLNEILVHLKTLSSQETAKRQSSLALELFNTIVAHGDLSKQQMFTLATNLWGLAQRQSHTDYKQMSRILEYVKSRARNDTSRYFAELVNKMPLDSPL